MNFSSSVLTIDVNDRVATVWLDRPEKRNAISMDVWVDLPRAMAAIAADDTVSAVIIAGRGKSFCVGLDLEALQGEGVDTASAAGCLQQVKDFQLCQAAINAVADCPVPVIAAVHSHCLGAGVDLITACDIRFTAEDAVFGVRETKIGIVADVGTLQRLPKIINPGHLADLVYTGRDFGADHAREIGLVTGVYADAEATYEAAQQLATEIAANAPLAVRGSKFILQQGEDMTTEQSLLLNGLWTMVTSLNSNDLKEAMVAFAQKRPPTYTGS
jgi:enoyl-CoA hydratase/carnithine racemase